MALSIIQTPAAVSLAQSPIIFAVSESNASALTSASFQYNADLYYWTGTTTQSGSAGDYTLVKYPNESLTGIFDTSRILNSTLQDTLQSNTSNAGYLAIETYISFYSGSLFQTGSRTRSDTYKYLDGYQLFQETIGQAINTLTPHWPLMTDGPATQSVLLTNSGSAGVYVGTTGATIPTKIVYTSAIQTVDYAVTGSVNTSGQITTYPIGPAQVGFPLSGSYSSYTIQAFNGGTSLGQSIKYEVVCAEKYPNIRVKWKNRYGQWDFFNFSMVNRQSFSVNRSLYEPQIGSWGGRTLSYENYDSSNINYLVDTAQAISVNTDWVSEDYNDIFKQLLVSDEIYWLYDEVGIRPITIKTPSITFKTGVNDKVIQYAFDFDFGQNYKLII
jgi:hypothetical protein